MMARKMSQPVCAVSLELLTASSRLYGLTGVSVSGLRRALSAILLVPPRCRATYADLMGKSVTLPKP